MYMEPIVRARPPLSPAMRRLTGVPVLLLSILVMLPWLAAMAIYSGAVLGLKALPKLPRTLMQMIDYAGSVALGR